MSNLDADRDSIERVLDIMIAEYNPKGNGITEREELLAFANSYWEMGAINESHRARICLLLATAVARLKKLQQ